MSRKFSAIVLTSILCLSFSFVLGSETSVRTVKIYAPAVARTSSGYVGAVIEIAVTVTDGSGEVYVSTTPLTEVDMQASARTAALIACQLVDEDFNKHNFYVVVNSSSLIVGGPSAGAEMTIAIASALRNWRINYSVMMTGMVNPDETIGPVGGIPEKLEAAAKYGVKLFLIPIGQRYFTKYEVTQEKIGPFIVQRTKPVTVDLVKYGEKLGVRVLEIGDVREAIYHFTGNYIPLENYTELPKPREDIVNAFKGQYLDLRFKAEKAIEESRKLILNVEERYRRQLSEVLSRAEGLLDKAGKLASSGMYYSASSVVFQSLVQIQYVENVVKYLSGEAIDGIVDEARGFAERAEKVVNETDIGNINALELAIAARWRVKDAFRALEDAAKYYGEGEVADSLRELAYAKWRSETAVNWVNLSNLFSEGEGINWDRLRSIVNSYIYEAETVTAYVQTVLNEMGYSSDKLNEALKYLDEAKEDYSNGNIVLAFGEAMHSLVYASSSMVLIPTSESSLAYQIEYSRRKALNSIWKAVNSGLEPILGYAYYEYAGMVSDEASKLTTYKLASAYTTTLMFVLGKTAQSTSTPIATPMSSTPKPTHSTPASTTTSEIPGSTPQVTLQVERGIESTYIAWLTFTLIVGVAVGVVLGFWYAKR